MIKINNLLAASRIRLDQHKVDEIEGTNRFTGETTGKLLTLLGEVISNPNKRHLLPENSHGHRGVMIELETLKNLCSKLDLNCMVFRSNPPSVEFKLYSFYDNKYELLNGREL